MMRLARIGIGGLVPAALVLSAAPCFAPPMDVVPENFVPDSDAIAVFTVVKGDVTSQTVFKVPQRIPEGYDFHLRETVMLRVDRPVQGCREGEVFYVRSPRQHGWWRAGDKPPVFLWDGQQILAYLAKQDGDYVAIHIERVRDGIIEMDVAGPGWSRVTYSVDEALAIVAEVVARWNAAQTYDVAAKTSEQLVEDYGHGWWLNRPIIKELVSRRDAAALYALQARLKPWKRYDVVRALSRIPGAEPVPYLLRVVSDNSTRGYHNARAALEGLARAKAKEAGSVLLELFQRDDAQGLVRSCLGEIARVCVAIGDSRGVRAVLDRAAEGDVAGALPEVIEALGPLPEPEVEAFLMAHLRGVAVDRDWDTHIMWAAAKALAKRGPEGSRARDLGVTRLLELKSRFQGSPTIRVLGEVGDKRAVPLLLEMLPRARWDHERNAIVGALVKIGDERAIEPLVRLVRRSHFATRAALVQMIGQWDHPEIRRFLMWELKGGNREAMCAAAVALHNYGAPEAAERLLTILDRGLGGWQRDQRLAVYAALAELGDERALPGLIEIMDARRTDWGPVAEALRTITGADLPARPEVWREWWEENRK